MHVYYGAIQQDVRAIYIRIRLPAVDEPAPAQWIEAQLLAREGVQSVERLTHVGRSTVEVHAPRG